MKTHLWWRLLANGRWDYQRKLWFYLGDGYPGGFGGYHGA